MQKTNKGLTTFFKIAILSAIATQYSIASDEVLNKKLNDKEIKYTLNGDGCYCFESQVEFYLNNKKQVESKYNYINVIKGCGYGYNRTKECHVNILSN